MKKDWRILLDNLDFKQEEWEDNILQWTKKAQLIFHQVPDLELKNPMSPKSFIQA